MEGPNCRAFHEKIDKSFEISKIKTRRNAGHGLWVSCLLPLALCMCSATFEVSSIYKSAVLQSIGLVLTSILIIITSSMTATTFSKWNLTLFPILFFSLLDIIFLQKGIIISIMNGIIIFGGFQYCLRLILYNCPESFTFGEAIIVSQSIILFIYTSLLNIVNAISNTTTNELDTITIILQMGMMSVIAVVMNLFLLHNKMNVMTFCLIVGLHVSIMLTILHILLLKSPVLWILFFVFDNAKRMSMIVYWIFISTLAVIAVNKHISSVHKASTSQRKIFHLLAVAVYIPGIICEYNLTYLATGIALAAIIALETVRKLNLGWFSDTLNEGFKVFSDEKDAGGLSITPIYLLLGVSCPIFLLPSTSRNLSVLPLFSGIISIGIGDTFASYIGSNYGKHKILGSQKSIEGTLANIVSQAITIITLASAGFINLNLMSFIICMISISMNCAVEAITDQVDNLILPLITFIILILA